MEARELIARALRQNLHAAVVIIADPSRDSENVRLPLDEPAEADTLHTSANDEASSLYRLFGGAHAKRKYIRGWRWDKQESFDSVKTPHSRRVYCARDDNRTYARDRYAPSEVSTLIFSPSLMNGGTWTIKPVSVLAGFVTLEAVALFRPGSVSITVSSTV